MRLGGLVTLLALCALVTPAHAATHQVNIGNNAFVSPSTGTGDLTITEGDVVTWHWVGPDTNHSTTTTNEHQTSWDSDRGNLFPNHAVGDKFSRDFPDVGEFPYFCKTHPDTMNGKIVVVRKENNPNPPTPDTVGPEFGTPKVESKRRRVTFNLDEPANVEAKLRGPTRRTLKPRTAKVGLNVLRLPRRLKPGRYALVMRATDEAGNKSVVVRVKFRVR
jgi:plastocyanin